MASHTTALVSNVMAEPFGIEDKAKRHALRYLEQVGLVAVERPHSAATLACSVVDAGQKQHRLAADSRSRPEAHLRAVGLSFEDRQDLLGHRSGRIKTHCLAAELSPLIEATNGVVDRGEGKPELVVLRRPSVS